MEIEVNDFIAKNKKIMPGDFINEIVENLGLPINDVVINNQYIAYFRGDNKLIYKVSFMDKRAVKITESE